MIEITNKAIATIAQSIYDETFKPLKASQDKKIQDEKNKIKLTSQEKKVILAYVKASDDYQALKKKYAGSTSWPLELRLLENNVLDLKKRKCDKDYSRDFIPTIHDIESTVTMATVDAKDMNELIAAVKIKYKV